MISETFRRTATGLERQIETNGHISLSALEQSNPAVSDRLPQQWWTTLLTGGVPTYEPKGELTSIDLFCGSGGLSLGTSFATNALGLQFKSLAALDIDESALAVFTRNFHPDHPLLENLASILDYHVYGRGSDAKLAYPPQVLEPRLSNQRGNVDLLLAGPPCQGHSNLNNHTRRSDPRNQLYVAAASAAIALHAKAVIIENVPDVLSDRTEVVATAKKILSDDGYLVSDAVLHASAFGAAQNRKRHILVATRRPHVGFDIALKCLARDPASLREAIGDLLDRNSDDFMDEVPRLSAENQSRIDYLFSNQLHDLPNDQRPNCHKNGHTYPSVYGRLYWDRPSPTLTTGFMSPGRGRYIHPELRRVITAREAARIQGFPDSFQFQAVAARPSKKQLSKWIGDAVPTQLGYAVALIALTGMHLP